MKLIQDLSEYIEEEICDSEKYALMAMKLKESYPEIANVMYMLSLEEMKHMQLLHEQVTKVIAEYKRTNGDPPVSMQAVYDFLHEKYISEAKEVKVLQDMYVEK